MGAAEATELYTWLYVRMQVWCSLLCRGPTRDFQPRQAVQAAGRAAVAATASQQSQLQLPPVHGTRGHGTWMTSMQLITS